MNKLSDYLEKKGIMQKKFARNCGTTGPTIYKITKCGRMPSLKIAISIEKETEGLISVYDWVTEAEKVNKIAHNQKKRKKTKAQNSKL